GGMVTILGRTRATKPPSQTPHADDVVIFGSPVWAGRLPPLMRGFLGHLEPRPKRWAGFVTMGGEGADTALAELTERMGSAPIATLSLSKADFETGSDTAKLAAFVDQLRDAFAAMPEASPA
ncbi:MAG: hypothetical protein AAFX39_16475, partial [Pseudomonadota bacterium]